MNLGAAFGYKQKLSLSTDSREKRFTKGKKDFSRKARKGIAKNAESSREITKRVFIENNQNTINK